MNSRWDYRCDLCYGNRFTTDKGLFVVVGVQFDKDHNRSGLYVCSNENLGKGTSVFIKESVLIKMELNKKFKII